MVAAPCPSSFSPQLCTSAPEAPAGDKWLHEIKYDGWRLLARKSGSDVRLFTRGGVEWSKRLPLLSRSLVGLPARDAWLDGELVYLGDDGRADFHALHDQLNAKREHRLYFQVWDLLWHDGRDLCVRPLIERKAKLANLLRDAGPRIRYVGHVVGQGADVFQAASAERLEGIVSKRIDSRYRPGDRSRDWVKVKAWQQETVWLGGVQFAADGGLEALLVGSEDHEGLRYVGRVEFGLHRLRNLEPAMNVLSTSRSPFTGDWLPHTRRVWLRPEIPITVKALPRAAGAVLRHATLVG